MAEWVNYGNENYAEYGGILLRETDRPTKFEFVDVSENPNGLMQALMGTVDIADYFDTKNEIFHAVGMDSESTDKMQFACAIVKHYGAFTLRGQPVDFLSGEYNVTKYDLCKLLNDLDFPCEYEFANTIRDMDNSRLANYIDDFLYDFGEYEHDEESRLSYIDHESRALTVDNIKELLDKGGEKLKKELICYFEGLTFEKDSLEPEMFEKAEIIHDALKVRSVKEKVIEISK